MHSRFGFILCAVAARAQTGSDRPEACSENNCDGEESTLMSVQLLQTDRHISKTKSAEGENFVGVKRDFSDVLSHHDRDASKLQSVHGKKAGAHGGKHGQPELPEIEVPDLQGGLDDVIGEQPELPEIEIPDLQGGLDDVIGELPELPEIEIPDLQGGLDDVIGELPEHPEHPDIAEVLDAVDSLVPDMPAVPEGGHGEVTGVGVNADDDIYAFLSALMANVVTIIGCIAIFMALRGAFPKIYSNNVEALGVEAPADTTFGWAHAAINMKTEESADKIGLDNALLLKFCTMCMKIMLFIGIPLCLIEGPLNMFFGGNAAGLDYMSYLSFGNVAVSHPWLYYVHAGFVWYVIITVIHNIYVAQREFLVLRTKWLKSLPDMRANTLLVEGIPEQYRSDTVLKKFFEKMMGAGSVQTAYCVKNTSDKETGDLAKLVAERDSLQQTLRGVKDDDSQVPKMQDDLKIMKSSIDDARKKVRDVAKEMVANEAGEQVPHEINLSKAFVTFKQNRTAQIALNLQFDKDSSVWVCSVPPEPKDLLWSDLVADPTVQAMRDVIGYALVVGLYFAYMPLVIGISNLASAADMGPLQSLWEGLAPTLGLQFMIAFLPTILLLIFRSFFILKADAWSQTRLQKWYFWFQVVFVILVTAIGDSVVEFTTTIFVDPIAVFGMLAETMPHSTHFYMNFLVLQWTTHAMNLLRYVPLSKFRLFKLSYEEEEARAMAEPEDQDYYGLGSRSARFTINMVIGIVYSTLSPTVALLCLVNFACCRLFYGYLINFAETKKPDLGGVFWVTKLEHLFIGTVIYCVLMTGVLFGRAPNGIPGMIVAPSIFYVMWSLGRFKEAFLWENLPFEVVADGTEDKKRPMEGQFVQPELAEK